MAKTFSGILVSLLLLVVLGLLALTLGGPAWGLGIVLVMLGLLGVAIVTL